MGPEARTSCGTTRAEWIALAEWAEAEARVLRTRAVQEIDALRADALRRAASSFDITARAARRCAEEAR